MIPLPAEVKECLQKSIRLTSYTPFNQLICCISVSSYMLTRRFAVHLNRSLVGLLGIVIKKTVVAYLRSFPCVVVKKAFEVTCRDPETEVGFGPPRIWIHRSKSAGGYGPPFANLDPPTKLSL